MNRRVVITGIGVISSIGIGRDEFWNALIGGKSGISRISSFDTSKYPTHYGGEIKDFNPTDFISRAKLDRLGRTSILAVSSAKLALEDAALDLDRTKEIVSGVIMGTTMGESGILEIINEAWVRRGESGIDHSLIPMYPANVISHNVAKAFELEGLSCIIPTACAAGNYAIGYAYDLIRQSEADIMLAGGVDAFSKMAFTGFNRLLAVAPLKCQPFDKNRKGMIVGEGSAVVVVESLDKALERKANIYAEVIGYGLSCDAHHMTAPEPNGVAKAIENALEESSIYAGDVDYISAHGTGTPVNDKVECMAVKKIFADSADKIVMSSIKSMLGHTMGAASAIETIACCMAVKNDVVPPTINYETPDPECDIDCVPNVSRSLKVDIAINNASAFGGNNACLVLKKFSLE